MLGSIVMLISGRSQRLGDLAAGTIVVKERREVAPRTLSTRPEIPALPPQMAAAFTADDVALARDFLLRRGELTLDRREQLSDRIAARFRRRLGPELASEPAEQLLERIAALRR